MIKRLVISILLLQFVIISAQVNNEALENFESTSFINTGSSTEGDAIILFDRTYLDIKKGKGVFEVYKTVHRKIKINTLYALEQYNKLYVPVITERNINLEFVDCKAKTLKKNRPTVITNKDNIVTTTLPANTPFFYKIDGKVKMMAISSVDVGDQIEYVYTTKQLYDKSEYFYTAGKVNYSSNDYCLEKSLIINAPKHDVSIWPHNFGAGVNHNTSFLRGDKYEVSLSNINPRIDEIYSNPNVDEPYLYYEIEDEVVEEFDKTWEDFAKFFKPKRRDTKESSIFDGQSFERNLWDLKDIEDKDEQYTEILKRLNKPVEETFVLYEEVRDDIDISLSYAKVISKTAKRLKLPMNFHFVRSKSYGELDKSFVSLYQFDNIICSFVDSKGNERYFPLLEPYSTFDDIRKKYQQTESFTIVQGADGKRTHEFKKIPSMKVGVFQKNVALTLKEKKADTLKFNIKESIQFTGHSWINIKPVISYVISDSLKIKKRIRSFVESQVVQREHTDSIYNIEYDKTEEQFKVSYEYDLKKRVDVNTTHFDCSPYQFFEKDFYTPYSYRGNRLHKGYFTDEFNTQYNFSLEGGDVWLENKLLNTSSTNQLGKTVSVYQYQNKKLDTSLKFTLEKDEFLPSEWSKVLELREAAYDFLSTKLYFKI